MKDKKGKIDDATKAKILNFFRNGTYRSDNHCFVNEGHTVMIQLPNSFKIDDKLLKKYNIFKCVGEFDTLKQKLNRLPSAITYISPTILRDICSFDGLWKISDSGELEENMRIQVYLTKEPYPIVISSLENEFTIYIAPLVPDSDYIALCKLNKTGISGSITYKNYRKSIRLIRQSGKIKKRR